MNSPKDQQAIDALRDSLQLRPDDVNGLASLSNLLLRTGQFDAAIDVLRRLLILRPNSADICNNLGSALQEKGRFTEALMQLQLALQLRPIFPEAQANYGSTLLRLGRIDEAIASFERTIRISPGNGRHISNLAAAHQTKGDLDQAIDLCRTALAIQNDLALTHLNLGTMLLTKGQFPEGWREFEWRLHAGLPRQSSYRFDRSAWTGEDLAGRRIVLHHEQGAGDTIQFIRYVPLIAQRGGKIILTAPVELHRLLAGVKGIEQITDRVPDPSQFQAHCPLPSLPHVLGTTLETIPDAAPYLRADAALEMQWKSRLPTGNKPLKVGLVWAGRPEHMFDRYRSIPLASLSPLAEIANVWFCSLQTGAASQQAARPPRGMALADWTKEFKDWADTAALISQLDLIVTVDTAVAHLAGALGKRCWMLVQYVPDWRWLLDRTDSPWYPTLRLFRQKRREDWTQPIAELARALAME